jgi:hypothetical protein
MGLEPLPERVYLTSEGDEIPSHTVIESNPGGLMFHTRVASPAIEVHSSFVTSAGRVSAAHLLVGENFVGPRQAVEPGDVPLRNVDAASDRFSFLLDHLAHVRDAVASELGQEVRLDVQP